MEQLPLIRALPATTSAPTSLDQASEELLGRFRALRIGAGANPRSVAREVSQLRAVAREAGASGSSLPLQAMLAAQRFIMVIGPALGRDAESDLRRLDALLPARPKTGWHEAGTLVAGGCDPATPARFVALRARPPSDR